jgi:glycosyltransferase involved in cell wall biosynthesis
MKVISISTDKKILEERSPVLGEYAGMSVLERQIEYASRMEELHIIVFSLKKQRLVPRIFNNLFVYPTNSSSQFTYIWDAYVIGKKLLKEKKFSRGQTVVTTQDPFETGLVGYVLALTFSLPLQLQVHTDFVNSYFQATFVNWLRSVLAYFLIPKVKGIRVVSESIKEGLVKTFSSMDRVIAVLPVYVDIQLIINAPIKVNLHDEFPQFKFIVFMASRLTKEKNIETALYALQHIVTSHPYVGLVIAGTGPERAKLEQLATSLGVFDNVVFIGWKNDLISYYKTCNVFLVTSVYEGYGMTLIEAAAAGTCIITTPVGIAKKFFIDGENSFVCPIGDHMAIYAGLNDLLSNNAKRELFKQKIQDSIRGMASPRERYMDTYVKLLESLL